MDNAQRRIKQAGPRSRTDTLEVFFCTCPQTERRQDIASTCQAIWEVMDVELTVLTPQRIGCSDFDFQKKRRMVADLWATNDIYVLTDDDCIPYDIEKAVHALHAHPEFGIISLWPQNATIQLWTPESYQVLEDLEVTEHHDVGGVRICRKGSMQKGWPPQYRRGYDAEHCEAIRASGYRVGYSQHARMMHLCEGDSSLYVSRDRPEMVGTNRDGN